MRILPYFFMAHLTHSNTLKSRTTTSLASACQNCLKPSFLAQSFSRNMSSQPKDKNNPKYGHLPLSTSGPEECALTVLNSLSLSPSSQLSLLDESSRVRHSSAPPTTIKAAPFRPMNAKSSSFTAYCLQMYRRWKCRLNGPIGNIAAVRIRWRRIRL